ncbi:sucrase ferredoxin [Gloeocapsopsis sp. IPPAS B-1203]|uniref:sucrase ferredoxin n=1 Tax=Gloeocapsopsis sp. IPPAS B-1203 TaxID=2049454 RepID=UPI0025A18164|nr:sucrase ferredoxin [Gloeocapsopsis sp. IPPAS B-1203]
MAQPWTGEVMDNNPIVVQIKNASRALMQQGVKLEFLTIAPDRDYSQPSMARILHYSRPVGLFAKFHKQEFLVPNAEISSLITALLSNPDELLHFNSYQQQTHHIREFFVCTHGDVDIACARFGYAIYKTLRSEYGANSTGQLRAWRCSHFGGHKFAPTLIDFPEGRYWGHLEPEILALLVHRIGSVTNLERFYRGWAGLGMYEQIAERAIWMQQGWDWLNYHKVGQTLVRDETHGQWNADWAEVRIDFVAFDGSVSGAYEARVEVSGEVMTMGHSGDEQSIGAVKQYRVSRLVRVV